MEVVVFTISIFLLSFVSQMVIWRFYIPQRYHLFITIYFLINLFVSLFVMSVLNYNGIIEFNLNLIQIIHIIIFYLLMVYPYLTQFTGIQSKSPTLSIIEFIHNSKGKGINRSELNSILTNTEFIDNRIGELVQGGYVIENKSSYFITKKGKLFLYPFSIIKKLLRVN